MFKGQKMRKYIRLFGIKTEIDMPEEFKMFEDFRAIEMDSTVDGEGRVCCYKVRMKPYLYPQGHRIYELENVDIYENGEYTLRYFPRYDHLIKKDIYGAVLRYKTRGNVRNMSGENNITDSTSNLLFEVYYNGTLINPEEFYEMDVTALN